MRQYILDCIDTDKDKINYLRTHYMNDYAFNEARYGTRKRTIEEWLRGLPSCINIEYDNFNIEKLYIKVGILKGDESAAYVESKVDKYWVKVATEIAKMFRLLPYLNVVQQATHNNNHTLALKYIAIFVKAKDLEKCLDAIDVLHVERGYMPPGLFAIRDDIRAKLLKRLSRQDLKSFKEVL